MVFSSLCFLYYFLPLTAALYFFVSDRLKNAVLLLASIVFYAWGEPQYIFLLGISVLSGYGFGLLAEKYRGKKSAFRWCIISVAVSLSFLLYFKYADFLLANAAVLTGGRIPVLHAALPVGISFYTFQMISYTVDVYRGETAQKNFSNLAVYITMFPQLVAGPIVRYRDISGQLAVRMHTWDMAAGGIRRFVTGLSKKILLANQLAELCGAFRASQEKSVLFYWLYAVAFMLQIYFDFSGYSDMAIGLGRIFGFRFPENFRYPYVSASITEFWRRWHISLGAWFRDYVYIPLGGNRVGRARQFLNITIVWMLTGLWHGASWNFVVWGLLFAALLAAEKLWLLALLKKCRVLSHIYVLFSVLLSFIVFNACDMGQAFEDIAGLFGAGGIPFVSPEAFYCLRSFGIVILAAAIGATPAAGSILKKVSENRVAGRIVNALEPLMLLLLLLVITAYLVDGSFQPFLYFRF